MRGEKPTKFNFLLFIELHRLFLLLLKKKKKKTPSNPVYEFQMHKGQDIFYSRADTNINNVLKVTLQFQLFASAVYNQLIN